MRKIIDKLLNYPGDIISHYGYIVIFLFTIGESIPILGTILPGQGVVMLGGFFAHLHYLNFWYLFVIVSIGAIIGDVFGYYLGTHYGIDVLKKYGKYVNFNQKKFNKLNKIIKKHPGKTIILGRFNSFTRSIAPFLAGSCRLNFNKFMVYNVIGGLLWAYIWLGAGYLFAKSIEFSIRFWLKFILAISLVLLVPIFYIFFRQSVVQK